MKIMIFCDLENFRHSVRKKFDETNKVDIEFSVFHNVLFNKVVEMLDSKIQNPRLIRAYVYTGQYTESQISKAKSHLKNIPEERKRILEKIKQIEDNLKKPKDAHHKKRLELNLRRENLKLLNLSDDRLKILEEEIENAEYRKQSQDDLFKDMNFINFLELKLKPLKYSFKDLRFVQKGTDVEMAVDIVNFAHFNNYDIAVICTGDLDLLESCRLIKTLGKTFVLISHKAQVGDKMIQSSDLFLDINKFSQKDLEQIAKVEKFF